MSRKKESIITKSVALIGAGIGGLATGCYAQMNGYDTQIFEMGDKPGGLCTAWERKGYTIDGCLHWLWASSPSHGSYHLWEELGMVQGKQIINMDELLRVEAEDGKVFCLYTNADRLEQHMKEIAPEDRQFTEEFTRAVRRFVRFNMPVGKAPELYSSLDAFKMLFRIGRYLGDFRKWSKMTLREMAQHFKNPFLRDAWQQIWYPQMSAMTLLVTLSSMHSKSAGYVVGGSMALSHAIETRYLNLGGKISYKKKVDKILVENDRAIGVRLADGTEQKADYVISAADGHATIFEMLDGKYVDDKIKGYYERMPIFQPLVFVGLGVNRSFEDMPKIISGITIKLEKPLVIGGQEHKSLSVRVHNFDPSLAQPGKTVLTCMINSAYPYWESLQKDIARYREEKEHIADAVISVLDGRFPGLANQVEMRDVATPVTFLRYTGNWQGCFEGWLPTPQAQQIRSMSKTLPGLKNFYMVGQWVMPGGGLPSGVITGRWVTQMMCKKDGKKFIATKA